MKKTFLLLLLISIPFVSSFGFGKEGHDIATEIALKNMSLKAKKNIAKYLERHDITYYSSWMDYMGYITKSGYTNDWFDHCVPVDKDFNYAEGTWGGDALMAVEVAIEKMKDGKYHSLSDSTVLVFIKHLVHFLPDMHCPSHVIYNFRSSNYMVNLRDTKRLFHAIWDDMTELGPHAWSATEWWEHLNYFTKGQKSEMVKGTPRDWVHDNAVNCIVAYDIIPEGKDLTDREWDRAVYNGCQLVEAQLVKAGLRLAYVLNMIFEK